MSRRTVVFPLLLASLYLVTACSNDLGKEGSGGSSLSGSSNTSAITLNGKSYTFPLDNDTPKKYLHAAASDEGIVWSPTPKMENPDSMTDMKLDEPFEIYLFNGSESNITKGNSEEIFTLPQNGDNGSQMFLDGLYSSHQYVIFTSYQWLTGTAQAIEDELYYLSPDSKQAILITTYHDAGGYMFDFGINRDSNDVVYIQSTPNSNDDYDKTAFIYHLDTGKKEPLRTYSTKNLTITYQANNKEYTIDDFTYPPVTQD